MDSNDYILTRLMELGDAKYAEFQRRLLPNVDPERVIGVRTPQLRALAKELPGSKEASSFIAILPHRYFEENQLHAFLVSRIKDFDECISAIERFLPYIDNWATCDQLSPSCFRKHTDSLLKYVEKWMSSQHEYTIRFAIATLMRYYLGDLYERRYLDLVASIQREEYYIRMMQAWYFATALIDHYEEVKTLLFSGILPKWTHNKTIQKAIESFRIPDENKAELRKLRI